jgi:hypothetical protein
MSQKWSRRPQTMPADFPYVWVSGLHLWQAPRTVLSTRRFGVRGVTCTTCPNVTDRNRMSQKWSHHPQTMPADFPYILVSGPHLWRSPRTARSTRRFGGWGGHMHHLPQNRQSQTGSSGPQTMRAGFSHVVVSRLHLENSLNAIVTWADSHPPSHNFHIVCI